MFELKFNLLKEKKESTLIEQEAFLNTYSGFLQIMRVKSENISLTDRYEFFRFLPITRNNMVFKYLIRFLFWLYQNQ